MKCSIPYSEGRASDPVLGYENRVTTLSFVDLEGHPCSLDIDLDRGSVHATTWSGRRVVDAYLSVDAGVCLYANGSLVGVLSSEQLEVIEEYLVSPLPELEQ